MKLRHHQFLKVIRIFFLSRVSIDQLASLFKKECQGVFFDLKPSLTVSNTIPPQLLPQIPELRERLADAGAILNTDSRDL